MASEKSLAADKPPAVSLDGAADTTEQPVAQDAKEKGNEGGFKDFLVKILSWSVGILER